MKAENDKRETIVCRCEDVTLEEVEAALDAGLTHPEEIKRFLHVGMGPCQGRTCGQLVNRIAARKTGKRPEEIESTRKRPPLVTVSICDLLGIGDE